MYVEMHECVWHCVSPLPCLCEVDVEVTKSGRANGQQDAPPSCSMIYTTQHKVLPISSQNVLLDLGAQFLGQGYQGQVIAANVIAVGHHILHTSKAVDQR